MRNVLAALAVATSAGAVCVGTAGPSSAGDYHYGPTAEREVVVTEREVPARIIERRVERRYYQVRPVDDDDDADDTVRSYTYVGTADGCAWLYRRALRSGSDYWWDRYRQCAD